MYICHDLCSIVNVYCIVYMFLKVHNNTMTKYRAHHKYTFILKCIEINLKKRNIPTHINRYYNKYLYCGNVTQ